MSDVPMSNIPLRLINAACSVQRVLYITWTKNCGRFIRHTFLCSVASSVRNFCTFWPTVPSMPISVTLAGSEYAPVCTPVVVWRTRLTISHFLFSRDSLTTASNQPHPIYPYITHCTTRSIMPTHRMMTDVLCRCIHTTMLLPCYPPVHMLMLWYTIINSHIMVGTYIRAYTHLTEIITNE